MSNLNHNSKTVHRKLSKICRVVEQQIINTGKNQQEYSLVRMGHRLFKQCDFYAVLVTSKDDTPQCGNTATTLPLIVGVYVFKINDITNNIEIHSIMNNNNY